MSLDLSDMARKELEMVVAYKKEHFDNIELVLVVRHKMFDSYELVHDDKHKMAMLVEALLMEQSQYNDILILVNSIDGMRLSRLMAMRLLEQVLEYSYNLQLYVMEQLVLMELHTRLT
jgi:hypothetical protein